jgi:hypothetical protein
MPRTQKLTRLNVAGVCLSSCTEASSAVSRSYLIKRSSSTVQKSGSYFKLYFASCGFELCLNLEP